MHTYCVVEKIAGETIEQTLEVYENEFDYYDLENRSAKEIFPNEFYTGAEIEEILKSQGKIIGAYILREGWFADKRQQSKEDQVVFDNIKLRKNSKYVVVDLHIWW